MMKDYYQNSMRALQLAGMSRRTQECYTRSVRMLVDFYNKTLDQISEVQLQDYFLHRRNTDKWSAATMRICYSGIKFFFINVLQRDWHTLALIHAKREQRLPTVLSLDEVRTILAAVRTCQNKAYLTAVYSCGLRLHEALYLQVAISNRRIIKVENRKVFFKYKRPRSNRWRIISLDVMEFLRRFLQHALPTGFMKVRYYGFLSPASSVPLDRIRSLIELAYGFEVVCLMPEIEPTALATCPLCGGKLKYLYSVLPFMMVPAGSG